MKIGNEFIPYEQALALKELGFDEPCFRVYDNMKFLQEESVMNTCEIECDCILERYLAPLYQQAFRWFREKYNIDSWIQPFCFKKNNGDLFLPDESYSYFIFKDGIWVDDKVDFLEPEEAELECLKKLIEIVNNKK